MGSKLTFKPFFKSYDFGDGFAYTQWAWQGQEIVAEIYRHTVDDGDVELTTHYEAIMGHPTGKNPLLRPPTGENMIFPVGSGLYFTQHVWGGRHPYEKMRAACPLDYKHFQGRNMGDYSWEARAAGAKAKRWVRARHKEEVDDG